MSGPARDTVLCLCELGWLYSKVEAYIKRAENAEIRGLVVQAFGFSLQEELHDYYRLLAILEQELALNFTAKSEQSGDSDGNSRSDSSSRNSNNSSTEVKASGEGGGGGIPDSGSVGACRSGLTLVRLRAWMQEPIDRMCLMARLVESAGPLAGGALASRLHGHSKHGDLAVSGFVQRVMNSVCTPVYNMINRWILHGELLDPHKEFFVGYRLGVAEHSMWRETYFFRPAMLPSFLSLSLAMKIVVIGKSINFMRACAQRLASKASEKPSRVEDKKTKTKSPLITGEPETLQSTIEEPTSLVNEAGAEAGAETGAETGAAARPAAGFVQTVKKSSPNKVKPRGIAMSRPGVAQVLNCK